MSGLHLRFCAISLPFLHFMMSFHPLPFFFHFLPLIFAEIQDKQRKKLPVSNVLSRKLHKKIKRQSKFQKEAIDYNADVRSRGVKSTL